MDLEFYVKCGHKFHVLNLEIELNDNISITFYFAIQSFSILSI